MKRMFKKIVCFFTCAFIILILNINVFAVDNNTLGISDVFPEDTIELLEQYGFEDLSYEEILNLSPNKVVTYIADIIKKSITAPYTLIYFIFLIILVISIASAMNGSFLNKELENNISGVGILCLCSSVATPLIACISDTIKFISNTSDFIKIYIPSFASIIALCGQGITANSYSITVMLAAEIVTYIISNVIIPLMCLFLVFSLIYKTTSDVNISSVITFIKSFVVWILGLSVMLFVSLITIKGIVGAGADSMALRTGKFFIGSFVPAVGGALSEAASTVKNSMLMIKNTGGVFGIIVIFIYFMPSVIRILLYKFACDISASIGGVLGASKLSGVIKDISVFLGILIGIILSFAAILILSTAVILTVGD